MPTSSASWLSVKLLSVSVNSCAVLSLRAAETAVSSGQAYAGSNASVEPGHLREFWRATICKSPHGCWSAGCQKNGEGRRGAVSPTPLIALPETRSSAIVSGLAFHVPRRGRRGLHHSVIADLRNLEGRAKVVQSRWRCD